MKLRGFVALPLAAAIATTIGCAQQPVADTGEPRASAPVMESPRTDTMMDTRAMTAPSGLDQSDVRQVQEALNQEGHDVGPVDGIWGPRTQSALRDFQDSRGLEASGELDRQTALALGFSSEDIAAFEISPDLSESDIRQVQESLNQEGHNAGPVDGIWGPMTENALMSFQEANGLDADGQLDRDTVLALGLPVSEFAAGEFMEDQDEPQQRQPQDRDQDRQ